MAQAFLNVTQTHEAKNDLLVHLIDHSITEIDIPEGATRLGAYIFAYCYSLKRVTIPESVALIDSSVFWASGITGELVVPSGCHSLYGNSLAYTNFTSMKLGNTALIQKYAFADNSKCLVYDFTRNTSVPRITGPDVFRGILPDAKILVPSHLYNDWIKATNWVEWAEYVVPAEHAPEVTIPERASRGLELIRKSGGSYEVIGRGECTDSVVVITDEIADGAVTGVGDSAFIDDKDIRELFIMGSVAHIGNTVCNGSGLKSLYMENVQSILSISFVCDSLEYVRFSSNIQYIGGNSFISNGVKAVYDFSDFTGENIPELEWEAGIPGSTLSPEKILVPIDRYDEWKNADNWSYYADKIFPAI